MASPHGRRTSWRMASAFAESADRPLAFNFELFLLDVLALLRHIVPRDLPEEVFNAVLFEDAADAINYCTERLERKWKASRPPANPTEWLSCRLSQQEANKWELFHRDTAWLTKALTSR